MANKSNKVKTRKSNGEGGWRKLKNGRIEGSYTIHRQNGTSFRKSFVRDTNNEILDIKAKIRNLGVVDNDVIGIDINRYTNEITLIRKGQSKNRRGLSNNKDITVAEYMDFYLEEHRRNGLNGRKVEDTTFGTYVDRGNLIKKYIGNEKMADLTFEDLDKAVNELNADNSDTTGRQCRDIITNMMYFAKKDGVIEENVLRDEKLTLKERKGKKEKKIIQEKDRGTFLQYCKKNKYNDLIFLLNTGTRIAEMAGVTWNNIDWEKKKVVIEKAYTRIKQKEYKNGKIVTVRSIKAFKDLKTTNSYRRLKLNDKMIEILRKHKEEQKELAKKNNKKFKETDWVFTTSAYTGILHDYIDDKFRKVMEETKITDYKELTPHCLRHTFCSTGIEAGVNVEEMKELMGHRKHTSNS